ncbi:gsr1996 [Gloeobacter violaceus PCC 7421]|uniref:Gsr1996 protein n=1 Tax=Gloeobacter violaceus (strain ATCC 29082 / PCC 7421) TaxID=251221 RepID=Q7NJ36_GLOVI|nr:gsr1996 [Gloeobacter violaceus PCC 7421]
MLRVGGPRLLESGRVQVPEERSRLAHRWGEQGQTVVYLVEEDRAQAAFRPGRRDAAVGHLGGDAHRR